MYLYSFRILDKGFTPLFHRFFPRIRTTIADSVRHKFYSVAVGGFVIFDTETFGMLASLFAYSDDFL